MSPDWSVAPDPVPYSDLTDPQSLNLYSYVRNSPTSKVDKDGHCLEDACVLEISAGIALLGAYLNSPQGQQALHDGVAAINGMLNSTASLIRSGINQVLNRNRQSPSPTGQSNASANSARKVPNPNGRKGDQKHQDKVKEIQKEVKNRGLEPETEYQIKTPNGEKSSRYVDVVGKDPTTGEVIEMHQVGEQTQSGNPVAREVRALDDIEQATGQRAI